MDSGNLALRGVSCIGTEFANSCATTVYNTERRQTMNPEEEINKRAEGISREDIGDTIGKEKKAEQ